ncbi:hypothetical protein MHC_02300 [Mycoplasma haemocanis str. Illinois]|uniref:Uncharacterized protein n=1 Tax=Mycoplasma haemocanis (strain Illinois) TaxID=1111676 RepID=H6N6Q4_MYCHN|nr:hypothetical protein [Mycoplasma haemocanis]AEW45326.1 hypothetical protein MHC_02300 [Mycoplasma haemocanis str. Illinois]
MNLKILTLSGVTVAGLGTAATYGFLKSQSSTKSVAQRLQDEGFVLLKSNSDQATINKVLGVYKTLPENSGKTPSISDLLTMCSHIFKKDYYSNDDYKKSRRFCVIPKTVLDSPKLSGKTILKNGENNEEDKSTWESLKTKYSVASNTSKKIKGLDTLTGSSGEEWKSLRNQCKNLLEKDSTDEDYDDLIEKSLIWCIKDASGLKLADQ